MTFWMSGSYRIDFVRGVDFFVKTRPRAEDISRAWSLPVSRRCGGVPRGGSGQMDEEVAVLDRVKKSEVEKIFSDTQVTDRRNIKSKEYQNVSSVVLSS